MKKIENTGRLVFFALAAFVFITACGRKGPDAPPNTMPAAFSFTAKTDVPPNTVVTSNIITVSGINTAAQISIVGGEYSVDGGAYTSAMGTVMNGQKVTVRLTSSPNFGTTTDAVLTIGGISCIFSVTTVIMTTTTTIIAPAVPYGTDGIVTVTVSSAAGTPIGSVLLSVDGPQGTLILQQLSGGSTIFTIPKPSADSHTLNATYLPDGGFQGSSATGTLGVGVGATSMTLSAPEVTYNANGFVTITMSSAGAVPTGNVSLIVDNGTPMIQTLSNGSTIFMIPTPSAPSHDLSATYAKQGNFDASSTTGTLNVKRAPTTTTISPPPPVAYGEDGSVTVTVSSAAGTPTGDVSLSVDGTPMTPQTLSNGSTTFTIPGPSAGSHDLSAAYAAQGNFDASSTTGTLGVGPGATTMTLSAPTVSYGADGSVTVTVSATGVTPTGDVSLSVDGTPVTPQPLIGGSATFTIPMPSVGSHTLSAAYPDQGNYFLGSSASGTLSVKAATTTSVASDLNPSNFKDLVTFTATVTSTTGTPTGTVTFSNDGTIIGTGTLSGDTATFSTSALNKGVHSITADYSGDTNFDVSISPIYSQTVQ